MSANINYLKVDLIRIDGGTQSRAHLNQNVINEYADLFSNSSDILPPIKVFFDGQDYWNADGFHRLAAAKQANLETISAIIEQGTRRDAILFSVGANAEHGLRRTDDDKRRAVNTLLTDDEWLNWSDNQIAKKCKVSQPFVSKLRKELNHVSTVNVDSKEKRTYERNGKTHTMHTDKIGKSQPTQNNQEPDKDPNTKEMFESNQFKEAVKQELENSHPELAEKFDQDVELPSYNVISEEGKILDLRNREDVIEILAISELRNTKEKLAKVEQELEKANQKIIDLELGITAKNEVINKNYKQIDNLTKTNNQLFLANENLNKELSEIKQNNVDLENRLDEVRLINSNIIELEKNNKNLKDRIDTLIKENETLKEANGRLKLVVKPSNSNQSDEMLVKIKSIFEASLEKGKEKREGIRIGRTNSIELLNSIKQALGVE